MMSLLPRIAAKRSLPWPERLAPAQLMDDIVEMKHAVRARQRVAITVNKRNITQDVHRVEERHHIRLDLGPLPRNLDGRAVVHGGPDLLARPQAIACIVHPNAASHLTQFMSHVFELVYSLDDRLAGHQLPSCHLHSDLPFLCMLGSVRFLGP